MNYKAGIYYTAGALCVLVGLILLAHRSVISIPFLAVGILGLFASSFRPLAARIGRAAAPTDPTTKKGK